MTILTIDFETYYSQEFSLTKMTTEEYIRADEFEVIGVSVQVDDAEPVWFSGTMSDTEDWLKQFDWTNSVALAHNAMFDAAILSWCFNIKPKRWLDTLSMGRAVHGTEVGGSLAVLAKHYELGVKGDEVVNAKGLRRADFPADQLTRYGEYCKNDVALTYQLFRRMGEGFPAIELKLIDLTVRMFSEPVLRIDPQVLHLRLKDIQNKQNELLKSLGSVDKDQLMSNPKFADVLTMLGVTPPMKVSPTTGKETYAFSKTDEGLKALLEHEDYRVQAVVAARLGVKSTLEETRTKRFIEIAYRGNLPVPLRYYAAHTGRWGGDDKLNLQNIPRGSPLKKAIVAPPGYVFLDSDSSQIEARTLAWLAGQNDLVKSFEDGEDVYKIMASAIYGKPIADITKDERFMGKTTILGCIAEGTLVLSESGWKPIELVTLADKLWDGEEWVCHQGLQNSGIKETLNLCGIWLTPDHKVWSGTQWLEAQFLAHDASTLSRALDTAAANLPLQATYGVQGEGWRRSLCDATATATTTPWTNIISKISEALDAHSAPRLQQALNGIGCIQMQCQATNTALAYSIGWLQPLPAVIPQPIKRTHTTGVAAYQCINSGATNELRFFDTFKHWMGGIVQSLKWIESMSTVTMNPATSDLCRAAKTSKTSDELLTLRRKLQTYDLAYSGPRNRYVVLTEQGPVIVHNCGYGMGAKKFRAQLKNSNVEIGEGEAERIVNTYRDTYPHIVQLWKDSHKALDAILGDQYTELGPNKVLKIYGRNGIRLPNGLYLKYPNLRKVKNNNKEEYVYDTKRGKQTVETRIYGGKVVENVCQALARIIIGEQMLMVAKKYKVVMTVHDAIGCIVPKAEADLAKEYVELCMRLRPEWATELPLNCEAGYGLSYGDC